MIGSDVRQQGEIAGELAGKVAIVTGAAAGIGLATARRFAAAGACVVLADCDEATGAAATAALTAQGARALFVRTDVADEDDVRALVARTVAAFGGLDVLFNNAGLTGPEAATADVAQADWQRVLAVNLSGTFHALKHGIPAMLARGGGAVVNNASIFGLVGFAGRAAYSAAKGGVIALTRTAALDYATRNVRINCICPGFVDTRMVDGADAHRLHAFAKVLVPMGRLGQAEEVAELALFLASPRASYLTGAVLPQDGGYVAR